MRSKLRLFAFVSFAYMAFTATAKDRDYNGFCEASAAAKIDDDHVAIASDDFDQIVTYERKNPIPGARFDLSGVTDIEAAARIGDTIFWLASHSLNSDKEDKRKRKVLFATEVMENGALSRKGNVYRGLRADIAGALGRTDELLQPRFNIEGLADTPDGHVIVGLRGPKTDPGDKTILVEITNPFDLLAASDDDVGLANIADSWELDLSGGPGTVGRGVRDIARAGTRYLIVAGSEPDGGDPPSKLFWWDGKSNDVTAGPSADFSGITPEAVVVWNENNAEVFSDDGENGGAAGKCDDKKPPPDATFSALDINF